LTIRPLSAYEKYPDAMRHSLRNKIISHLELKGMSAPIGTLYNLSFHNQGKIEYKQLLMIDLIEKLTDEAEKYGLETVLNDAVIERKVSTKQNKLKKK